MCLLVLAGCNPFGAPDDMMEEYVVRVARVLDLPAEFSDLPAVEPFPRPRDRTLVIPATELGMLDFLSLYGCELQRVVGEKASIMGRVMQPLNRLRYEVRFIEAARECLPDIENEEFASDLQKAIESKEQSLPLAVWNATWGVEEMESLFTLAKGRLPVESRAGAELTNDLRRLNQTVAALNDGNLDQNLEYLGAVHQRWLSEHKAGQLINSARLLIARLADGTALMTKRLDSTPLCIGGQPNAQAKIVQSMFFSVYIEKIQPYLASVRRHRDALVTPLTELARQQREVMPAGFESYYQNTLSVTAEDGLWQRLDLEVQQHTEAWQALLEQCGMRPVA
ncbi:DUF3080 domain-containing protein [Marinobacter changyiensis]|uniref:DUF3080 domain-containing protein n=1 Tax=Marinobacter changyiensis TaxID=2604091 RepID=UPI001FE80AF0|nr:DUF3080 domain-containing protein [Marinobacter changyiensis]